MSDVLRGAVPLPTSTTDAVRERFARLGALPPAPLPRSPFAPPIEEQPAAEAPAVTAAGKAEKSPERMARARAKAGALARERAQPRRNPAVADPPPAPQPEPEPEPVVTAPEPAPPAPSGPQPCEACGIPVSADYIARTGRARHGHHPA